MRSQESRVTVDAPELSTAIQHHKAGNLRQAEALYRRVLKAQPNHCVALHLLGDVMRQVGKYEVAIDLIGKAIALEPNLAEAHHNLGYALR